MEEDIKILENLSKEIKTYNDLDGIQDFKPYILALENLIKGYREYKKFYHRRLKEWRTKFENQEKLFLNELDEYDEEREKLKKQLEDSIPKLKIKEKIEEWDKSIKWNNADDHYYAIRILQELMEDQ